MLLKTEITEAIHTAMHEVRDGHHDAADAIVKLLAERKSSPLGTIIIDTLMQRLKLERHDAVDIAYEIVAEFNLSKGQ